MQTLKIEEAFSPHRSARNGAPICMIIYHYTGAKKIQGTLSWFQMRESKVSSHYVIGRHGRIVRCVPTQYSAWHAGKSEWWILDKLYQESRRHGFSWRLPRIDGICRRVTGVNRCSIGIELVGVGRSFSPKQMRSCAQLTARILRNYPLIERSNCRGHEHVAKPDCRKVDPGPNFDWEKLWRLVDLAGDNFRPAEIVAARPKDIVWQPEFEMESGKDPVRERALAQWRGFMASLRG